VAFLLGNTMTTFKTGNPVGSAAAKDLYDNAENLDTFVNDRTKRSAPDRLGVERKTWHGMEQDFQDFLINSGYQDIGDYAAGLEITARNQVFWKDGELYRAGAALDLPYTTTGDWLAEGGLFVAVGDQVLRQDLAGSAGAGMVGYQSSVPGSASATAADALNNQPISLATLGVKGDGSDETAAITAILQYAAANGIKVVDYSGKTYRYTSNIDIAGDLTLEGNITFHGDAAGFSVAGSIEEIGTISAAAYRGNGAITVTSVAGISPGDLLVIQNTTSSSFSPYRANYYDGEYVRVRSVSGQVISLQESLRSGYAAAATNKVYKLNTVKVDIRGVSFTGGAVDTLRIDFARDSVISPKYVGNTFPGATGQSALSIRNSYNCSVSNGTFHRIYDSASGLNYGIVIGNSAYISIQSVESFGGRHAVAVGGNANPGAIPNRGIYVKDSVLSNDPASAVYCADFHGNTLNSFYENCVIYGGIGLAGENIYAKGCTIYSHAGSARSPLTYHELVGGDCAFMDCKVFMGPGSTAANILNNAGSELLALISRPYKIVVSNLTADISSAVTTVINAVEGSGKPNSWHLNDFNLTGDSSGLTGLIRFAKLAAGVNPVRMEITAPRSPLSSSLSLVPLSGTTLSGTICTMPEFTVGADVTIPVGATVSTQGGPLGNGTIVNDYPDFPAVPQLFLSSAGESSTGPGFAFPVIDRAATVVSCVARMVTGTGGTTATIAKTYRLSVTATMRNYLIP